MHEHACVHVASARTIREIAQGSLIPVDCALFVAVVQAAAKKSNLTVDPTVDSCLLFPFPSFSPYVLAYLLR